MKRRIQNIENKIKIFFFRCAYYFLVAEFMEDYRYRNDLINFEKHLTIIFRETLNKQININN